MHADVAKHDKTPETSCMASYLFIALLNNYSKNNSKIYSNSLRAKTLQFLVQDCIILQGH